MRKKLKGHANTAASMIKRSLRSPKGQDPPDSAVVGDLAAAVHQEEALAVLAEAPLEEEVPAEAGKIDNLRYLIKTGDKI